MLQLQVVARLQEQAALIGRDVVVGKAEPFAASCRVTLVGQQLQQQLLPLHQQSFRQACSSHTDTCTCAHEREYAGELPL